MWKAIERVIPDIRQRQDVVQIGTPLTHERFLRRHRGTYGPAVVAGEQTKRESEQSKRESETSERESEFPCCSAEWESETHESKQSKRELPVALQSGRVKREQEQEYKRE